MSFLILPAMCCVWYSIKYLGVWITARLPGNELNVYNATM